MKKILSVAVFFFVFFLGKSGMALAQQNEAAKIAPELRLAFERGEKADFLIVFKQKADVNGARQLKTKNEKATYVYERLRETATRSQAKVNRILSEKHVFANSFYLVNAIAVEQGDAGLAKLLAQQEEVERLAPDPLVHFPGAMPVSGADLVGAGDRNTIEWGIEKINAPAVWAMGYYGQGITVGGADTGYDWVHPALQPHYRGFNVAFGTADHNYNWHDAIHDKSPLNADTLNPCGFNISAPCDDNSHGTHTMGTMTGDDNQGNQIGVAPGAKWVGCRNMERGWGRPSSYIECFEWFLAPTDLNGENPDVTKAPHVINNSWYCSVSEGCTDLSINNMIREAIINLKSSGVVVVISNGNSGGGGFCETTLDPPANFKESFCVGATDNADIIAGFSSRGPIVDSGLLVIKPNVSAPGVFVRSSTPGNNYAYYSGTSMAGPHTAGLVALLLSARPDLSGHVELIEDIVQTSSFFIADTVLECTNSPGSARPNHSYGWGRIDALAAVNEAMTVLPVEPTVFAAPTVRVFPNPVQEEAVFELEHFSGKTVLTIYSTDGKLITSEVFLPSNNRHFLAVPMKNTASGVYFWQMTSENSLISGKLVKK